MTDDGVTACRWRRFGGFGLCDVRYYCLVVMGRGSVSMPRSVAGGAYAVVAVVVDRRCVLDALHNKASFSPGWDRPISSDREV